MRRFVGKAPKTPAKCSRVGTEMQLVDQVVEGSLLGKDAAVLQNIIATVCCAFTGIMGYAKLRPFYRDPLRNKHRYLLYSYSFFLSSVLVWIPLWVFVFFAHEPPLIAFCFFSDLNSALLLAAGYRVIERRGILTGRFRTGAKVAVAILGIATVAPMFPVIDRESFSMSLSMLAVGALGFAFLHLHSTMLPLACSLLGLHPFVWVETLG